MELVTIVIFGGLGLGLLAILAARPIFRATVNTIDLYISKDDVMKIKNSVNSKNERGGTYNFKGSTVADVEFTAIGKKYGGSDGIIINGNGNTIHTHPDIDRKDVIKVLREKGLPTNLIHHDAKEIEEIIDASNEVPSPADVAIAIRKRGSIVKPQTVNYRGGNGDHLTAKVVNPAEIVVTPSRRFMAYKITPATNEKLGFFAREPTGLVVYRQLQKDMERISEGKRTSVPAVHEINRKWVDVLYKKYGIVVESLPEDAKGVKIKTVQFTEVK